MYKVTYEDKENSKWRDNTALDRFRLISPLLQENLDKAAKIQLRENIAMENGLSTRTLYRYEKSWHSEEFEGLKPASREQGFSSRLPENYGELLAEAIQLRKEVPERSVDQIILILELEGKVEPGALKRSTLERHLYRAGFGAKQMRTVRESRESSSKRFCKPHRMMLIQLDIKYGPVLNGPGGKKIKTYLSSAIDDHSRYLLYSHFYDNQEETIVTDTFRKSILRFGKFDRCYCDNGSQYIARQLQLSLARLGIRCSHAPIRSGKSKGKVEKFHQVADDFIREAKLKKIGDLGELNRLWDIFVEEYYLKKPHDGISEYYQSLGTEVGPEGISPLQEWNRDTRPLTYIDTAVVSEAFLFHQTRRVDKGGCISFHGRKYETRPSLIGFDVEISYDPEAPETLTVRHKLTGAFIAKPLQIGSYCDAGPDVPVTMQEPVPETSRFLDALEKRHEHSKQLDADAISFAGFRKEVSSHV